MAPRWAWIVTGSALGLAVLAGILQVKPTGGAVGKLGENVGKFGEHRGKLLAKHGENHRTSLALVWVTKHLANSRSVWVASGFMGYSKDYNHLYELVGHSVLAGNTQYFLVPIVSP